MSLLHIQGDLLDWSSGPHSWNVIVGVCNCQNTFGAGLAKAIKDRYPAAYQADTEAYQAGHAFLGWFSVAEVEPGRKIVNLYAQDRYGTEKRHLNYEAFYSGMEMMHSFLLAAREQGRIYSLGIPYRIGCGLAGGEWTIIQPMIAFLFDKSPVNCYIIQKS